MTFNKIHFFFTTTQPIYVHKNNKMRTKDRNAVLSIQKIKALNSSRRNKRSTEILLIYNNKRNTI